MYAKNFLKASGADKSAAMKEITTGTFIGAAIGTGAGLVFAYKRQGNYLLYAFIGLMAGGIITRVFIAPQNKKSTTLTTNSSNS